MSGQNKQLVVKLEELRLSRRCTKRELAQKLGISEAMYCRIISGQRSFPENHINTIASLLDADPTELRALSLADRMMDEADDYPVEVVDKAINLIKENTSFSSLEKASLY